MYLILFPTKRCNLNSMYIYKACTVYPEKHLMPVYYANGYYFNRENCLIQWEQGGQRSC